MADSEKGVLKGNKVKDHDYLFVKPRRFSLQCTCEVCEEASEENERKICKDIQGDRFM